MGKFTRSGRCPRTAHWDPRDYYVIEMPRRFTILRNIIQVATLIVCLNLRFVAWNGVCPSHRTSATRHAAAYPSYAFMSQRLSKLSSDINRVTIATKACKLSAIVLQRFQVSSNCVRCVDGAERRQHNLKLSTSDNKIPNLDAIRSEVLKGRV